MAVMEICDNDHRTIVFCGDYSCPVCGEKEKNKKAKKVIVRYGQIEGDHHRTWVLDQALRILCDCWEETVDANIIPMKSLLIMTNTRTRQNTRKGTLGT